VEPTATFVKRFGDLVALLRVEPGNDAAQDLALTASCAAIEQTAVEIDVGDARAANPDDLSLKGRLRSRQVGRIRIAAGTGPHELLMFARALSHDSVPVRPSAGIQIDPVGTPLPPTGLPTSGRPDLRRRAAERRSWSDRRNPGRPRHVGLERRHAPDRRDSGERRLELLREQRFRISQLHEVLGRAVRSLAWDATLTTALALVRLAPRVSLAERRSFGDQLRRAIPRRAIEALVELGEREAEQREGVTEVLRWVGLEAAEVVLDHLLQGEGLGVRGFYYEVLSGTPGVYGLITPLLGSRRPNTLRPGAAMLGRLGKPSAVDELVPLMRHEDESVRTAAVRAIGEIHEGPAAEPLRQALRHPDGHTRAAAAEAIGAWRGGSLALLLVAALDTERDRDAWQALVTALGRLATAEACAALGSVAVTRRSALRRQGYTTTQRLAAVEALGLTSAREARATLERLTREAEGVVRYAADRILEAERQRAG
jgi:HEAT repeat protein